MSKEKLYSVYNSTARVISISKNTPGGYVSYSFKPGENFIVSELFEQLKDVPMFKEQSEVGYLGSADELGEIIKIGTTEDKGFTAEALKQLPADKLIAKIKGSPTNKEGCIDAELLYRLKEIENRNTVIRAIDSQFEKLEIKVQK